MPPEFHKSPAERLHDQYTTEMLMRAAAKPSIQTIEPPPPRMQLRPVNEKVLLRPEPETRKPLGTVVVPDTAGPLTKLQTCAVVAVGEGWKAETGERIKADVAAGDRVLIPRHTGITIDMDGEPHKVVAFTEILAVVG